MYTLLTCAHCAFYAAPAAKVSAHQQVQACVFLPAVQPACRTTIPRFPCAEHETFHAAQQRRKHLNNILLDACEEYHRIYDANGWPRAPIQLPLQPQGQHTQPLAYSPVTMTSKQCSQLAGNANGHFLWTCAYEAGGQGAADLAKQIRSSRSPSGTVFALTVPVQAA
jgi:hypothetical protein